MKAARHMDVTRPPRQLPRSQCISQFAHGPLLGHLERIDLKLRPSAAAATDDGSQSVPPATPCGSRRTRPPQFHAQPRPA